MQLPAISQKSSLAPFWRTPLIIDDLPKLEAAVVHITARHAAAGVMPEHYDAVGAAVLQAIKEVLGEAATAEVLQAWGHAYGFLASVFKEKEAGLYQSMSRKRA